MGVKALSPDIELISQKAGNEAVNNYQSWIGTPHLFLATARFLNANKEKDRYTESYENFSGILKEYGITGENFTEMFLELYPGLKISGETYKVEWHEEGQTVRRNLKLDASKQKRQMQVEDLIKVLFSDSSFILRDILEYVLKSTSANASQKVDELAEKMADAFNVKIAKQEIAALEKVPELVNLNKYVRESKPFVVGADNAVNQIQLGLSGKSINNVILVGLAGTGKTVSVYEFVKRIINKNTIKKFHNKIIYQLDAGQLVAGTRYRGDMEAKLMNIIKLVIANPEVILFIDEAHMMVKLGDAEGAASAGNILKPFITRGEIQMIWATTTDEYQKNISKDKALERRFHRVNIIEPSKEETYQILKGVQPGIEEFFGKHGSDKDLIQKVLDYSEKYTLDQANPAKAINMLELAFANSTVFNEDGEIVMTEDIRNAIKVKYNINISETKATDSEKALFDFILGQDAALTDVVKILKRIDRGLVDPEQPLGSVILAGPTGVGKTETAKIISKVFFGSEKNFIKINGGEYSNDMDITKITGSAPGYIGSDDESGLVSMIKQYPSSVVLFDECEKMADKVFDALLNILDTGEMTDNHGNRVSFRNALVIFTTNLGYDKDFAKAKGQGVVRHRTSSMEIREAVEKHFRPEFINRLDEIIVYAGLTNDIAEQLIERYRKVYVANTVTKNDVKFSKTDIAEIIKEANIESYGARGLKKAVKKQISKVYDRLEKKLREKIQNKKLVEIK